MKSRFKIYYNLSEEELSKLFQECNFFIDTNVLLDCVRLRPDLGDKLLRVFKKFEGRIFVAHHVAYEYHRHIAEEIARNKQTLAMCKKNADNYKLDAIIPEEYSLYIDREKLKDLNAKFDILKSSLVEELGTQLEYWSTQFKTFSMSERVNELLSKYLLPELPDEEYAKRKEEGLKRIGEKMPPGYLDNGKEDNKEGDYIIWTEILEKSAADNKSAIFVTEDLKEDWMEKPKGLTNGPRHELRQEFYNKVPGCEFHAYTTGQFLRFADPQHEILTEEDIKDIDSRRQLLKEEKKKINTSKNYESETKNNNKTSGGKNG